MLVSTVYGVIIIGIFLYFMMPQKRQGKLKIGKQEYPYTLGNNLEAEMILTRKKFLIYHGIDVELPKTFPHIYLDAHKDSAIRGPRFKIDDSQRISLEGDFDSEFNLYTKTQSRIMALSVITPDVMQKLMHSADRFDVELKGKHLRLISQKRVYRSKRRNQEILRAAEAVLKEIDHKIISWNDNHVPSVHDTQLYVYPDRAIRFGRLRIRTPFIWCTLIGLGMSGFWFYGTYPLVQPQKYTELTLGLICVGWLLLPFLVFGIFDMWERKSPNTYWKYYGWWK